MLGLYGDLTLLRKKCLSFKKLFFKVVKVCGSYTMVLQD